MKTSFQPTLSLSSAVEQSLPLQLMKSTVLAKASVFISMSLSYEDIYRLESGRCYTLLSFVTYFFLSFYLSRFSFYIKIIIKLFYVIIIKVITEI
jgi:hypothetical protein